MDGEIDKKRHEVSLFWLTTMIVISAVLIYYLTNILINDYINVGGNPSGRWFKAYMFTAVFTMGITIFLYSFIGWVKDIHPRSSYFFNENKNVFLIIIIMISVLLTGQYFTYVSNNTLRVFNVSTSHDTFLDTPVVNAFLDLYDECNIVGINKALNKSIPLPDNIKHVSRPEFFIQDCMDNGGGR